MLPQPKSAPRVGLAENEKALDYDSANFTHQTGSQPLRGSIFCLNVVMIGGIISIRTIESNRKQLVMIDNRFG